MDSSSKVEESKEEIAEQLRGGQLWLPAHIVRKRAHSQRKLETRLRRMTRYVVCQRCKVRLGQKGHKPAIRLGKTLRHLICPDIRGF